MADRPQDSNNQATAPFEEKRVVDYGHPIKPGMDLLISELKSLERAISRIQDRKDGQTSPDFHNFRPEHYLSKAGLMQRDNCSFEQFSELMRANFEMNSLAFLLEVLRPATRAMQMQEVARAKLGQLLHGLPQELLSETLHYACSDVFDLIKFSHVNRRFRQAALGVTSLWSRVSSDMSTELVRLCIERSGNASLHVVFNEGAKKYSCFDLGNIQSDDPKSDKIEARLKVKDFTVEVAKSSTRWKSIEFHMPYSVERVLYYDGTSHSLYLWLTGELRNLDLSRLESLSIKHQGCLPDRSDGDFVSSKEGVFSLMHFYASWEAPKLRSLSFTALIPAPIQGASIEELTLDIRADPDEMDFSVALQDLLGFLAATPSLHTLVLRSYYRGYKDGDQPLLFSPVVLENLKSLTLTVDEEPEIPGGDFLFTSFVASLRIPNLISLAVRIIAEDISSEEQRDVTELVNSLIPDLGVNPRLENLSVFVYVYDDEDKPTMSIPLEKYPSLQSLEISLDGKLSVTPGSTLHPKMKKSRSLKQITLDDCAFGVEEWISWIVGELRRGGNLEQLKVVLKGCEFTSERSLMELISPGRLEIEQHAGDGRNIMSE
ncbi:hypothetical protein SCHPADRAFT_1000927 [Schizopora paradoxa]|uniref:F-box domain-containing protein n=1 Tax=Schizopora paradoxa TaxID=27342 RepID=A0A0H2RAR5_9AGAM|nr:hypothetical protein SCHPADRAFT_1000927 [Schizopora paradoxa]